MKNLKKIHTCNNDIQDQIKFKIQLKTESSIKLTYIQK